MYDIQNRCIPYEIDLCYFKICINSTKHWCIDIRYFVRKKAPYWTLSGIFDWKWSFHWYIIHRIATDILLKIPSLFPDKNKISLIKEMQNIRSSRGFFHLLIKCDKFVEITVNPNISTSLQWYKSAVINYFNFSWLLFKMSVFPNSK